MALKVMRFYGWSWAELMATPISAFWTCSKYIDRLRAEETYSQLDLHAYGNANEEGRRQIHDSLKERTGTVTIEIEPLDPEGWNLLKKISNG